MNLKESDKAKKERVNFLKACIKSKYLNDGNMENFGKSVELLKKPYNHVFMNLLFKKVKNSPNEPLDLLIKSVSESSEYKKELRRRGTGFIIKSLREEAGLTQNELATKLNLKTAAINKYESGTVKNIKKDIIEELSNIFNVSPAFIMGWEAREYKETEKLPILGVVRAGFGGIAQEDIIGYHQPPSDGYSKRDYFYLKVKGDSMEPQIAENCLALVRIQSNLENGQLGIILINGEEGVIKQVLKKNNAIVLHSFNPYYPDKTFENEEMRNIKILGRVVETTSSW